jgi:hypothetical protein
MMLWEKLSFLTLKKWINQNEHKDLCLIDLEKYVWTIVDAHKTKKGVYSKK